MSALRIFPPTGIDPQGTVINRAELNQLPVCFVRHSEWEGPQGRDRRA